MDLSVFIKTIQNGDLITVMRGNADIVATVSEVTKTNISARTNHLKRNYSWKFAECAKKGIRIFYGDEEVLTYQKRNADGTMTKQRKQLSEEHKRKVQEYQLARWAKIRGEA